MRATRVATIVLIAVMRTVVAPALLRRNIARLEAQAKAEAQQAVELARGEAEAIALRGRALRNNRRCCGSRRSTN